MSDKITKSLNAAVLQILAPLVRILLRNGIAYGTVAGLLRQSYVSVAFDEFPPDGGKKQTVSRVSALTGLTRKEVKRLLEQGDDAGVEGQARYSRGVRVVSGWMKDRVFHDSQGKPAVLPIEGARKSFTALVRKYSGDMTMRTMLSMLEEGGTVKVSKGKVSLRRHAYVPGRDDISKLAILGSDVAELIATIDHNLVADPDDLWFQRKVSYDNISPDKTLKLRTLSSRKAQALLESLDLEYAGSELDEDEPGGQVVSFGIYYHEHDNSEEQDR